MNSDTINAFRNQLLNNLAALEDSQHTANESTATVVLDQSSVGRLSRMDAMQNQQMAIATQRRRQEQITQIKAALKRIEDNNFGYCVRCDEEIPAGRLAINPAITVCVKCAG